MKCTKKRNSLIKTLRRPRDGKCLMRVSKRLFTTGNCHSNRSRANGWRQISYPNVNGTRKRSKFHTMASILGLHNSVRGHRRHRQTMTNRTTKVRRLRWMRRKGWNRQPNKRSARLSSIWWHWKIIGARWTNDPIWPYIRWLVGTAFGSLSSSLQRSRPNWPKINVACYWARFILPLARRHARLRFSCKPSGSSSTSIRVSWILQSAMT